MIYEILRKYFMNVSLFKYLSFCILLIKDVFICRWFYVHQVFTNLVRPLYNRWPQHNNFHTFDVHRWWRRLWKRVCGDEPEVSALLHGEGRLGQRNHGIPLLHCLSGRTKVFLFAVYLPWSNQRRLTAIE